MFFYCKKKLTIFVENRNNEKNRFLLNRIGVFL